MSKKVCTAGVRGSYSYSVVDSGKEIVARLWDHDTQKELVQRHNEMDLAERWIDKYLQNIVLDNYEID